MKHDMFEDIPPDVLEETIDRWVRGRNCARNRKILKERLLDGITFEALAEKHEMSVRQIKTIVYAQELAIFGHLIK
jgi:hypothetical protein